MKRQNAVPETEPLVPDTPYDKFLLEIQEDLARNDFAAIEQKADKAIQNKERLDGGSWKIRAINAAVSSPNQKTGFTDEAWQQHFARFEEWKKQFPTSITAYVGLGSSYSTYGSQARGSGYADTVSEEDRKLFHERLNQAEEVFEETSKLADRSPVYYEQLLTLGLGQGWKYEDFDKVFQEAIKYEPEYQYFYRLKAYYLLPRWYGKSGDWEKFAEETMNSIGGKKGAEMYYQIVTNMSRFYGNDFFQQNKVNWEKTCEGFVELEKNYGMSREKLNEMGRMAYHKFDPQMTCQIFRRLGENDVEPGVWQKKANFLQYRQIGLEMCQIPKGMQPNIVR